MAATPVSPGSRGSRGSPDGQPKPLLGVNLYSVRQYCGTEKELARTLGRLEGIGYRYVQVSGVGDIPSARIRALLDATGLRCCATHEKMETLRSDPEGVIEKIGTLGCDFTAPGSAPGESFASAAATAALADELAALAERFSEAGVTFGYHNHDFEFERPGRQLDGPSAMSELVNRTAGSPLHFELDLHWIVRGGGDPAAWLRRCRGRARAIHIKDFIVEERVPQFGEVGEGNLEWDAILAAACEAGTEHYIVEQDSPRNGRDIFDSLAISFRNATSWGIAAE